MQAYTYHEQTGEYLSTIDCQPSPREPGVFLVPALATTEPPQKAGDHEIAVWNGKAWDIQPDFRGVVYWHKRRPAERFQVERIGVYPDAEWTDQDPAQVDLRYVRWDDRVRRWTYDGEAETAAEQTAANGEARAYLMSTDWLVVRYLETGKPTPQEITDRRAAARAAAVKE